MNKKEANSRIRLSAGLCIVLGLALGFLIKRVHVGLLIGLALGLLSGVFFTKRN